MEKNEEKMYIIKDELDIYPTLQDMESLENISNFDLFIMNVMTDWYFLWNTGTFIKIKMRFNQFLYMIGLKKDWLSEEDYPEINWDITK